MTASSSDTATDEAGLGVRKAATQDLPMLVETLTAAFFDDPMMTWWMPDPHRRPHLLCTVFETTLAINHVHGELYTTEPVAAAAAIWVPPGCQPLGENPDQHVGRIIDAAEDAAERLLAMLQLMDKHHPDQPHDYLFFMGAQPRWQSRGLGSALLREVLARCDRENRPAYLEATSLANRRLYLRHGFEVTGEITLPDGPSLWPMWREPGLG